VVAQTALRVLSVSSYLVLCKVEAGNGVFGALLVDSREYICSLILSSALLLLLTEVELSTTST